VPEVVLREDTDAKRQSWDRRKPQPLVILIYIIQRDAEHCGLLAVS